MIFHAWLFVYYSLFTFMLFVLFSLGYILILILCCVVCICILSKNFGPIYLGAWSPHKGGPKSHVECWMRRFPPRGSFLQQGFDQTPAGKFVLAPPTHLTLSDNNTTLIYQSKIGIMLSTICIIYI